jgi:hypothetical protein
VEIVPSSLKPFPEVRADGDVRMDSKGKGKARVADGESLLPYVTLFLLLAFFILFYLASLTFELFWMSDKDYMDVDPSPSMLPPRMRKAWSQLQRVNPKQLKRIDHEIIRGALRTGEHIARLM